MALVDANYRFTVVDIGQMGSISDGGVWDHSTFGHAWNADLVQVPTPTPLPGTNQPMNYVIVADEAFPLKCNLLRPYPGRQLLDDMPKKRFNYRLSRARRVTENAFGILANRWRFLFTPVDSAPEKLTVMVRAAVVLHNILIAFSDTDYNPPGYSDVVLPTGDIANGLWRTNNDHQGLPRLRGQNHAVAANNVRERFKEWFSGVGATSWQDGLIRRVRS